MKALRPEEVAERWQCSKSHVYKLIANGSLDAFKIGDKLWRISKGAVKEFEKCHPTSGSSSIEDGIAQLGENGARRAEFLYVPKIVRLPN